MAPLRKLRFSCRFNQPLTGVRFPEGLREMVFGERFDRGIDRAVWLTGLDILELGRDFSKPLVSPGPERGAPLGHKYPLPAGLKNLTLGQEFNRPLSGSELPDGLQALRLGRFSKFRSSVRWPSGLNRLCLDSRMPGYRRFGGGLVGRPLPVELPPKLKSLIFGGLFNLPLTTVAFLSTLKVLDLGYAFDHLIGGEDGGVPLLPDGLEELRLGWSFNRSIAKIPLPVGLKRLIIPCSSKFDQSLAGVMWPLALRSWIWGARSTSRWTQQPSLQRSVSSRSARCSAAPCRVRLFPTDRRACRSVYGTRVGSF